MSKRFEVGGTYMCRMMNEDDTEHTIKVLSRTPKFVRVILDGNKEKKLRVHEAFWAGGEYVKPCGRYSMSPTICAESMR